MLLLKTPENWRYIDLFPGTKLYLITLVKASESKCNDSLRFNARSFLRFIRGKMSQLQFVCIGESNSPPTDPRARTVTLACIGSTGTQTHWTHSMS